MGGPFGSDSRYTANNKEKEKTKGKNETLDPKGRTLITFICFILCAKKYERKQATDQEVHGENLNKSEEVRVKVPPKPFEPTKEERQAP